MTALVLSDDGLRVKEAYAPPGAFRWELAEQAARNVMAALTDRERAALLQTFGSDEYDDAEDFAIEFLSQHVCQECLGKGEVICLFGREGHEQCCAFCYGGVVS